MLMTQAHTSYSLFFFGVLDHQWWQFIAEEYSRHTRLPRNHRNWFWVSRYRKLIGVNCFAREFNIHCWYNFDIVLEHHWICNAFKSCWKLVRMPLNVLIMRRNGCANAAVTNTKITRADEWQNVRWSEFVHGCVIAFVL